jgi:hypothetical protein
LNILLAFLPHWQGTYVQVVGRCQHCSLETRYRAYNAEAADGSTAEINSRFDGQQALPTIFNEVILASFT